MLFGMSLVIFLVRLKKFLNYVVQLSHCRLVLDRELYFAHYHSCHLAQPGAKLPCPARQTNTEIQVCPYLKVHLSQGYGTSTSPMPCYTSGCALMLLHLYTSKWKRFLFKGLFEVFACLWCWCITEGCPHPKRCHLGLLWWYDQQFYFSLPFPHFSGVIHCFALFRLLQVSDQKQKYRKDSNAVGKYDARLIWSPGMESLWSLVINQHP